MGEAIYTAIYIEVIYVGALFSRMINRCWYGKRKSQFEQPKIVHVGASPGVQRLGLGACIAGGTGSTPGVGTKISLVAWMWLNKYAKKINK